MSNEKPYRIVAKITNNRLWKSILEVWPEVKNQSQAARCLGMQPTEFGRLLNMKFFPGHVVDTGILFHASAKRISQKLGEDVEYLFDPMYYKLPGKPQRVEFEIGLKEIEGKHIEGLPPPVENFDKDIVNRILRQLTPREEQVIRLFHGLDGPEQSLSEIGEKFAVTGTRIQQIAAKAERKIRNFVRQKPLIKKAIEDE